MSPDEQRQRIQRECERAGLTLVDVIEEMDISGGAEIAKRPAVSTALGKIENGRAEVLIAAYFDRLFRSLDVQRQIIERVEQAGGETIAVDVGRVSHKTAATKLTATMHGMVAEYLRLTTAERTREGKVRAVANGKAPYPNVPPGYRRDAEGKLEVDEKAAQAVAEAFALRADGATIMEVREHLRSQGIVRSFHGVNALLRSRVVLGELRFGELVNESAVPAIVDEDLWRRVQKIRSPRGRRPRSERLLARLGVLRCGSCGARMVVGTTTQQGKLYGFYRCPPNADCERRVTISAEVAERVVVEETQRLLEGIRGSATEADGVAEAVAAREKAQQALDKAIRTFEVVDDEDEVRERLAKMRADRDAAQELVDARSASAGARSLAVTAGDWNLLTLQARRGLVQAVIAEAVVSPGRGPDRITVQPRGE